MRAPRRRLGSRCGAAGTARMAGTAHTARTAAQHARRGRCAAGRCQARKRAGGGVCYLHQGCPSGSWARHAQRSGGGRGLSAPALAYARSSCAAAEHKGPPGAGARQDNAGGEWDGVWQLLRGGARRQRLLQHLRGGAAALPTHFRPALALPRAAGHRRACSVGAGSSQPQSTSRQPWPLARTAWGAACAGQLCQPAAAVHHCLWDAA